ncbi:thioredoxin [Herbihabitans rhizosphaerae]|uniref:Thioredoxin n=1 Tax=Herbihabitans rhizosphaerae TaxID=1872711 RepID=A0A4Q7L5L7_9PSEU|nr:thioredoxin family protein [Herbihabitans rhizosphaerae]RZS44928.1 thioredoxin [Herbihabitans rhizosphaerae]
MTGVWVLVGTVVIATVAGLVWRANQGRVRTVEPSGTPGKTDGGLPADVRAALDPDAHVTLVQLSTTFCAPCRHTRVLLSDLAGRTDGLAHHEIDLTHKPELAGALRVSRTPTTLAVASDGRELLRIGGVPKRDTLLDALRPHLSHP